jgi:chromosome partitioning protein
LLTVGTETASRQDGICRQGSRSSACSLAPQQAHWHYGIRRSAVVPSCRYVGGTYVSKIIAVANLKGGVAKTTIATALASLFAQEGMTVTLVDADDHQASTWWGQMGQAPKGLTVLAARYASGGREWAKRITDLTTELVVLDVGGGQTEAVTVSMALCDLVIVPVPPTALDIKTARNTLSLLAEVRSRRKGLPAALLVPSRVDRRRAAGREIEAALHQMREPVAPAVMERAVHAEALGSGTWVGGYAPRSTGHHEISAIAAVIKGALWPAHHAAL